MSCRVARICWVVLLQVSAAMGADPKSMPEGEDFFFIPPGFKRAGLPKTAAGDGLGKVQISVRDAESGKPTFCRINVVGPDGHYYQPPADRLTPYALTGDWPAKGSWGNRKEKAPWRYLGRFFYSTGEATVSVPPGKVRIEVWKGFEFRPVQKTMDVAAGQTASVEFKLVRAADARPRGYYSGDIHLHVARRTEQDDELALDLLDAEDIQYGCFLGYNEPAGPYHAFMEKMDSPQFRGLGERSVRSRGRHHIISGQEYRSGTYGHLMLYLRNDLFAAGQNFDASVGPVYGDVGRETQAAGGLAVHAHGGYAQEIYADAALGTVNAVELLQFGIYRGISLTDWYHILNTGYRFPMAGASDWPACRWLGDCRTYVHFDRPPSFPDWLRGLARGQSFATTGPLLMMTVGGERPGGRIDRTGAGPHSIKVHIEVACEVTPVQRVDLIVNGSVAKRFHFPEDPQRPAWVAFDETLHLNESSWIAARAWSTTPGGQPDAEAHTNPVFFTIDGRAPYQQASLDAWVAKIDEQIQVHTKRTFAGKQQVLDYFQKARDLLLKIRREKGLAADANPAELAKELSAATDPPRLAADASRPDATDAELRAFLKPVPPLPAEEALKTFEAVKGFHVELVAAEPLVHSPVAGAFDADGNLYVCEMTDYPFKPAEGREPIGSVRLLRDTDGDGRYDKATVFADKLLWAAGVAPWKQGVFVAAPPDIWWFEDTDGDDRADVRRKAYTGFGLDNQQAMVNNLVWGLDHKIYGATAGNGGEIRPGDNSDAKPVSVTGRDFRFDPSTGAFETISGTVQFGNTFDDWGQRFVCSESWPLAHIVLPQEYLARNPYLPVPAAIQYVAKGPVPIHRISPIERWRQIRSSRRIATSERAAESAGASHHVVDAAAGVTIYRGGAYPPEYYGTVFVGDGQNNLVHHRKLIPDGVTFQSERVEQGTDFVRSSDIWFRPVNLLNAPDGTLYCLDMSREVLESIHIPLDVAKHLDFASGRNHGRIYRIAPDDFRSPPPPRLSQASSEELVALLESPHGWIRDTAHRLIHERQDASVVPALERLVRESQRPQSRLLALWSLAGLNGLSDAVLRKGLSDPQAEVRENAVRLAESRLDRSEALLADVVNLARDAQVRVRFQVAFSLGVTQKPAAVDALAKLSRQDGSDVWMRTAILSSAAPVADQLLLSLMNSGGADAVLDDLAVLVGARNRPQELARVLEAFSRSATGVARLGPLGRGLKRTGERLPWDADAKTPVAIFVQVWLDDARAVLNTNGEIADAAIVGAIERLSLAPFEYSKDSLLPLADPKRPLAVQLAAVRALADYPNAEIAPVFLQNWREWPPDVRAEIVQALLSRERWTKAFLTFASDQDGAAALVDQNRRDLLRRHRDADIRRLATALFAQAADTARSAAIAAYKPALARSGSVEQGEKVFERTCSVCHQIGSKGYAVGPNLASSPARDPDALLQHILDPNQYVLPSYVQYIVVDKQGRTTTGLIAAQTATSITLKRDKAAQDTILRGDIDELLSTGKSLMPEGLEKQVSPEEMSHLIAYLQQAAAASSGNPNRERDFGTLPGLIEPPGP